VVSPSRHFAYLCTLGTSVHRPKRKKLDGRSETSQKKQNHEYPPTVEGTPCKSATVSATIRHQGPRRAAPTMLFFE